MEAGLVREPDSYTWSSHRFYLRRNEAPKWLRIDEVMGECGTIARFHEFVLEGNDKALGNFYNKGRQSPVLGSEEFRSGWMEKPVHVDQEHPRYERAAVRPSVNQVQKYVQTRVGGKWLCVVVKYLPDDAFVITAYLTETIKAGETLWPKK